MKKMTSTKLGKAAVFIGREALPTVTIITAYNIYDRIMARRLAGEPVSDDDINELAEALVIMTTTDLTSFNEDDFKLLFEKAASLCDEADALYDDFVSAGSQNAPKLAAAYQRFADWMDTTVTMAYKAFLSNTSVDLIQLGVSSSVEFLADLPGCSFKPVRMPPKSPMLERMLAVNGPDFRDQLLYLVDCHPTIGYDDALDIMRGIYVILSNYVSEKTAVTTAIVNGATLGDVHPSVIAKSIRGF
jgi:hypothetical protein